MFAIFQTKIMELVAQHNQSSFPVNAFVTALFSLIKLSLDAYPDVFDRVDDVLGNMLSYFQSSGKTLDEPSARTVRKMLEYVTEKVKDVNVVLDFANFAGVAALLGFQARRTFALSFVAAAGKYGYKIGSMECVGRLFEIIAPIVKDVEDTPSDKTLIYTLDVEEEFVEEQQAVCAALQFIDTPELNVLAKLFSGMRKQLGQGGPERMRYTLKAMVSLYIRLALRARKAEAAGEDPGVNTGKLFHLMHTGDGKGMLEHLADKAPGEVFHLYLTAANAADTCGQCDVAYDLYAGAFALYDEHAATAKAQLMMLTAMIASLCALRAMPEETYDTLSAKLCQYSSKVVQKPDQSRMVQQCSHLFWKKALSDQYHKKAMQCLQKSLKIADNCPAGHQFGLFVEALNHYMYYYQAQMPEATVKAVQALIVMCNEAQSSAEDKSTEMYKNAKQYYASTKALITRRQREDDRWTEFDVEA
jgi:vacuolar protein sorting-associated protein 35